LIGNATRAVAVDETGGVWAAGEASGLSRLAPGDGGTWQPEAELAGWTVLQLLPRPGHGLYLALKKAGSYALGELEQPGSPLRLLARNGLACRGINAMAIDVKGKIWIGNAWGAHRHLRDGTFDSPQLQGEWVRALAGGENGEFWAGTNKGAYRLTGDDSFAQEESCPHDEVLALTVSPSGALWLSTPREVGRLDNGSWQRTCATPFEPFRMLLAGAKEVWACGRAGLHVLDQVDCRLAFAASAEDKLSNAVQILCWHGGRLWAGTARGLHSFDGNWRSYEGEVSSPRDIRDMVADPGSLRLWIGSCPGGLSRLEQGVYVPSKSLLGHVVALAAGPNGVFWAATPDAIYCQSGPEEPWEELNPPARTAIGSEAIQVLCYQPKSDLLWVGTTGGLHRFSVGLDLWDVTPPALEQRSIQALSLDPASGLLWAGIPEGLFSEEDWQRVRHRVDVSAIAFAPLPGGDLWVGTSQGLEHWPAPNQGEVFAVQPLAHFNSANSGLPADSVAALTITPTATGYNVWVGTAAGLSCLHAS
jgi:ligand-binding sensor domain-containing protein